MIHIESKTGRKYPIADMSEEHMLNTIDVLLNRCKVLNKSANNNPRYFSDIEAVLKRLSYYYFVADMYDYLDLIIKQEIQGVFNEYKRCNQNIFRAN